MFFLPRKVRTLARLLLATGEHAHRSNNRCPGCPGCYGRLGRSDRRRGARDRRLGRHGLAIEPRAIAPCGPCSTVCAVALPFAGARPVGAARVPSTRRRRPFKRRILLLQRIEALQNDILLVAFAGVTPASIAPGATAPTEVRQPSSETFVPPETEKMPAPPRRRVCVTGGQEDTGPVWISRPFGRQIPRRCGFWNTRFLQDAANTPLKSRQETSPNRFPSR